VTRLLLTTVAVLLPACTSPVDPSSTELPDWGDFELPATDTSLDPARLSVGQRLATPCSLGSHGNQLVSLLDQREWIVVDVSFGRSTAEGPWDGPTPEDKAWITDRGGRILHDFAIPIVRARVVASEIPAMLRDMLRGGQWPIFWSVEDLTRYDIPDLTVGFAEHLTDEHVTLFESLGGRVEHRLDFIGTLYGAFPDRSVSALREQADIEYLEPTGVLCLTWVTRSSHSNMRIWTPPRGWARG
jgi:hypothetical protein